MTWYVLLFDGASSIKDSWGSTLACSKRLSTYRAGLQVRLQKPKVRVTTVWHVKDPPSAIRKSGGLNLYPFTGNVHMSAIILSGVFNLGV